MNPQISNEINLFKDFLAEQDDLGIIIGLHQNLDTYAAGLALYLSLTQSGKKVQIISKKEPIVEVSGLVGINKVRSSFSGNTTKLVISLPYKKGEVEKVLFTEAPNTINFHLTAVSGQNITPFEKSDVKLSWEGGAPQAIITLGVGSLDELEGAIDPNATKIVNIDNFQGNSRFGNVVIVDESFSSLSEISGKLVKDLNLPTDADIAQNILDGVLYATRNFTKSNTSPLAFEAASAAMYVGAVRKNEEVRVDRGASNQGQVHNNQQSQASNRQHGGQQNDRGGRSDQRQPQNPNRQSRVTDNDFPAMHMQNNPRPAQNNQTLPSNENRRMNTNQQMPRNNQQMPRNNQQMPRNNQQMPGNNAPRMQQPADDNRNTNVSDIRNKIMEEQRQRQASYPSEPVIEEEFIPKESMMDTSMNAPIEPIIEDAQMPEEQPFVPQNNDDIPDDWLMPKVFKSSKNNN